MDKDEIIRMARELVKTYGVRMCDEDGDTHGEELYCVGVEDIAEIIKQVAAHEQEPVARLPAHPEHGLEWLKPPPVWGTPLYAAPVRTKDLTDDEIYIAVGSAGFGASLIAGCRAVIAADREKNK